MYARSVPGDPVVEMGKFDTLMPFVPRFARAIRQMFDNLNPKRRSRALIGARSRCAPSQNSSRTHVLLKTPGESFEQLNTSRKKQRHQVPIFSLPCNTSNLQHLTLSTLAKVAPVQNQRI